MNLLFYNELFSMITHDVEIYKTGVQKWDVTSISIYHSALVDTTSHHYILMDGILSAQ